MIRENIELIRQRIEIACKKAGRDSREVRLLGVSKTFSAEAISEAVDAGLHDIGENYVQELLHKKEKLQERDIRWHFIGHLQSNKVKYIVGFVDTIHALDNVGLAQEIDRRAAKAGRVIDVLVEVNTTNEQSKFGVQPSAALDFVKRLSDLSNIRILGLMTIGPFLPDPEGSRPMFRTLRHLKESIEQFDQPNVQMKHLSMGMTGDYEVAIDEGATIVRIGTAIFGKRPKKA